MLSQKDYYLTLFFTKDVKFSPMLKIEYFQYQANRCFEFDKKWLFYETVQSQKKFYHDGEQMKPKRNGPPE